MRWQTRQALHWRLSWSDSGHQHLLAAAKELLVCNPKQCPQWKYWKNFPLICSTSAVNSQLICSASAVTSQLIPCQQFFFISCPSWCTFAGSCWLVRSSLPVHQETLGPGWSSSEDDCGSKQIAELVQLKHIIFRSTLLQRNQRFGKRFRINASGIDVPPPLIDGDSYHSFAINTWNSVCSFFVTIKVFLIAFRLAESWQGTPGSNRSPECNGYRDSMSLLSGFASEWILWMWAWSDILYTLF